MSPRIVKRTNKSAAPSVTPTQLLWTRPDILFDGSGIIGAQPKADQPKRSATKQCKIWKKNADPGTHYTPADLAESWGCSVYTIRRLFEDDPDTVKLTKPNPKKRRYVTTTIPQEAATRMYEKLKRGRR